VLEQAHLCCAAATPFRPGERRAQRANSQATGLPFVIVAAALGGHRYCCSGAALLTRPPTDVRWAGARVVLL